MDDPSHVIAVEFNRAGCLIKPGRELHERVPIPLRHDRLVGIRNGLAGYPANVLRKNCPTIANNWKGTKWRACRASPFRPGKNPGRPAGLHRNHGCTSDAPWNRTDEWRGLGASQQTHIGRPALVQSIQLPHQSRTSVGQSGVGQIAAKPHIRAHIKMGLSPQLKPPILHANEILRRKSSSADAGASRREQGHCERGGLDKLAARRGKCLHGFLRFNVNYLSIEQIYRATSRMSVAYFEDILFWAFQLKCRTIFQHPICAISTHE